MGTSLLKLSYEVPMHAQLAEHLLMFDTVGLYCAAGHVIAEHFSRLNDSIGIDILEELIHSGALVLVPFEAIPMVMSTFTNFHQDLSKELGAQILDAGGGTVCAVIRNDGDFQELFEQKAKPFLPGDLISRLLSTAQWFRSDYSRVLDVSLQDMEDRSVFRIAASRSKENKGESFPGQARSTALQRLVWANTQMVVASKGYFVTGGWGDRGIVATKLKRVFASDRGEIASETFRDLLDVTSIPSITTLVEQGTVSFSDIIRLRRGEAKAFREWFQHQTENSAMTPRQIVREFTTCLLAGARVKPAKRRLTGFSLSQIAGLLHPLLGLGVSAAIEFGPTLFSKPSPYALFDSLRTYVGEEMKPSRG